MTRNPDERHARATPPVNEPPTAEKANCRRADGIFVAFAEGEFAQRRNPRA